MALKKVTELAALTTVTDDDLIYMVDDAAGTPVSKKMARSDFLKASTTVGANGTNTTWTKLGNTANDQALFGNGADLELKRASSSSVGWGVIVHGDTAARLRALASGTLEWGPGNAGADVMLRRTASRAIQFEDAGALELMKFAGVASAVNEVTATNAVTGGSPVLEATGGDTNIHLIVRGKGNGLTKVSVLRQDNTTNSYKHNTVQLTGWGFIPGDGTLNLTETVTVGITFAAAPVVLATHLAVKLTSDPTLISDFTTVYTAGTVVAAHVGTITTTTFIIYLRRSAGTYASGERVGYSWTAIGEL